MLLQVEVQAQHISNHAVPDADARQESWQDLMSTPIDCAPDHKTSFIIIADPSFWRVQDLLAGELTWCTVYVRLQTRVSLTLIPASA